MLDEPEDVDAPGTTERSWFAAFKLGSCSYEVERVNIECVQWDSGMVYCYVSRGEARVGVWPGLESDEWIEYIPAPGVVEQDGDLWWRYYSPDIDAMRYVQLTKGSDARRT